MKVKDALDRKPNAIVSMISPNAPLTDAVRFMCDNRIGSLLVQDGGKPVGIVTERDILRTVNERRESLADIKVADVMTSDLICGLVDDELNYIMGVMTKNRIRHLPIVNQNKIVGLISIGDVINTMMEEAQVENRKLHDYLHMTGQL